MRIIAQVLAKWQNSATSDYEKADGIQTKNFFSKTFSKLKKNYEVFCKHLWWRTGSNKRKGLSNLTPASIVQNHSDFNQFPDVSHCKPGEL